VNGNETKVITLRVKVGATEAAKKLTVRYMSTRGGIAETTHQVAP
jgi:hypothetical protein